VLFTAEFTIPANTLKASPASQLLYVDQGIVTEFMVYPRPGHAGLAHMIILYHEHQVAPSIEDMDLCGDTYPVDWNDNLPLDQPPYELRLVGWNDDDTYPHTFYVAVAILREQQTVKGSLATTISNALGLTTIKRIFTGGD